MPFRNFVTVLSIAISVSSFSSLPARASETLLNFVERAKSDTVTDTGAKGDSAGDILTFANEIYDEANAAKLGDDNGWCVRTVPGKAWECFWTVTLADGQITVGEPGFGLDLAVVGRPARG
jgi:allene oxide cyclase